MTKKEIIENIKTRTGFNLIESSELFETVISIMKQTLESGEEVKIARFGKFSVRNKRARKGRNPHTGEEAIIASRRVLTFSASSLLRASVNKES